MDLDILDVFWAIVLVIILDTQIASSLLWGIFFKFLSPFHTTPVVFLIFTDCKVLSVDRARALIMSENWNFWVSSLGL